jgi:hypothetical protein
VVKEENVLGELVIIAKTKEAKRNVNLYLKESTIESIEKLVGKGEGRTGMGKSELVDFLLNEAIKRLIIE